MQHFENISSPAHRYLFALSTVLVAAAFRYILNPVLGNESPLLIFTLPIVVSALYCGFGPALFATFIGASIGAYLFVEGLGIGIVHFPNQVRIALFVMIGAAISFVGRKLKLSQQQAIDGIHRIQKENRRKDEFLAMLGHELRNPLAAISAASELLKFSRVDAERVEMTSEIIARQVVHMSRLMDDLLDVSRVTRGLIVIDKKPLDLSEVVHASLEQLHALIDQRGHHLRVELPQEDAFICGDRMRLTQVVGNLLSNAAKYTPPGGEILVAIEVRSKSVELIVKDNGVGIEPALLPHVFDLFVQGQATIDRTQGGMGIGLALVKSLVALHGGEVSAQSHGKDKGSQFSISFPRHAKGVAKMPEPVIRPSVHIPAGKSLNILVVDDNRDVAQPLALLLEAQGHTVSVAYSATVALERARSRTFNVLMLDIGLPEIDGYELCRRLHSLPHLSHAVFIAITGYGQKTDTEDAKNAGFAYHFAKPVNQAELSKLLAEIGKPILS